MKKIVFLWILLVGSGSSLMNAEKPFHPNNRSLYCVCMAVDEKIKITVPGFITPAPESRRCFDLAGKMVRVSQQVVYRVNDCQPVKPKIIDPE